LRDKEVTAVAKQPARKAKLNINSVAYDADIKGFEIGIDQETPAVTALADAGPRRVAGNYDFSLKMDGAPDFASGGTDAAAFALLGNAGVAMNVRPTGNAAGANDPHYNGTVVLSSYSIKGATGGAVESSVSLAGNSALTRAVA
jgi:hypothetical protein